MGSSVASQPGQDSGLEPVRWLRRWKKGIVNCRTCGEPFETWVKIVGKGRGKTERPRMRNCPKHRTYQARRDFPRLARCRDCKQEFTLRPGQARSYYGYPARCPDCLAKARKRFARGSGL